MLRGAILSVGSRPLAPNLRARQPAGKPKLYQKVVPPEKLNCWIWSYLPLVTA
jgi:hypothetical protein